MSLFAIDSCYLQLARDKHLEKGQARPPPPPPPRTPSYLARGGRPQLGFVGFCGWGRAVSGCAQPETAITIKEGGDAGEGALRCRAGPGEAGWSGPEP